MTSRERVRSAIEHREPDLVPIDFGAMRSTGISAIAYNALKRHLGITSGATRVYDIFQQLAEPEPELVDLFGGDVVQLHRYEPAFGINISSWRDGLLPDGSPCLYPADYQPAVTKDGTQEIRGGETVIARMPSGGLYFDLVHHPYAGVTTLDELERVPVASMTDFELDYLEVEAKRLHEETDKCVLASFGGNILEAAQMDWGYETSFINLAVERELMHAYFSRLTDAYLADLERYLSRLGSYIDVIQLGDDLGTQQNLQISVDMYREMIKPYHTRIYRYVREHYPTVKVFLHSCGAISELIPDLIDAGVEILNPVQLSAKGMDPRMLKREYGAHLTFWGGGIDTQTTLTNGSVDDVRREVSEMMSIFAPGGGFIFTQVHNIQPNVSPEKIVALYETAKSMRAYPIEAS